MTNKSGKDRLRESSNKLLALINEAGIEGFEIEHRFHPTRRWKFDVANPKLKIGCEVNGGLFTYGRHSRGLGMLNDYEKQNSAQLLGWIVFNCGTDQRSMRDLVEYKIKEAVMQRELDLGGEELR